MDLQAYQLWTGMLTQGNDSKIQSTVLDILNEWIYQAVMFTSVSSCCAPSLRRGP